MKTLFLFLLCGLAIIPDIPVPEFIDAPAYYDKATWNLQELERSQYNLMSKATGLIKAESGFFLNAAKSPVRLEVSDTLRFAIKVVPGTDPRTIIDLIQFDVRNDKRVFITSKAKGFSSSTSYEKISYGIHKISDGAYVLSVTGLQRGEYFFGSKDYMFAFGID